MQPTKRPIVVILALVLASVAVAGCGQSTAFDNEAASDEGPSKVLRVKGSHDVVVSLTAKAAERIGIRTAAVRSATNVGPQRTVIPYAAVLYDAQGHAFAYTNPKRLIYIRRPVHIDRVEGKVAVLSGGLRSGTQVVTVGAAELLGVEYGVAED